MSELIHHEFISPEGIFQEAEIKKIIPVSGGCIHKSWCIELLNGQKYFAKTTSIEKSQMLHFEANCLKALKKFTCKEYIEIPEPITIENSNHHSILLLPWLELSIGDQNNLGKGLAYMHKESATQKMGKFGWSDDGFIGNNLQKGGWQKNWGEYFINFRLKPQFELALKNGLIDSNYRQFLPILINFLTRHNPESCLVHGDLWSGNAAINKKGKGIIFDPASYWADREVDIAMTKLFGGFSNDFYKGYNSIWEISKTFNERMEIYNLYHVINHANIFGGTYIKQSSDCLKKIILKLQN